MVFHALLDRPEIDKQLLFSGLKPFDAQKFVSEFREYPFQMSLHLWLSQGNIRENKALSNVEKSWEEHGFVKLNS